MGEMTEAETDEKNSQADYETTMKDSAAKRTTDSKALSAKGSAKADAQASLHAECDWLLQYFDARKAARAGEVESLKKAKAVLSGADYSLIQTRRHAFLRRAL